MLFSTFTLALVALPFAWAAPAATSATSSMAPLRTGVPESVIPDSYLVVFKNNTEGSAQQKMIDYMHAQAKAHNKTMRGVGATINLSSIKGYAINADNATLAEIRKSPLVAYVEKDAQIKAAALDLNPAVNLGDADLAAEKKFNTVQRTQLWNLPRISHRNNTGTMNYVYDVTAGIGTRVYVIDSGIFTAHNEFGGRAIWGANFVRNSSNTDENGHGTHVAGTVGGTMYGVAKQATLVAVKVLDASGSGSTTGLVQGIQWAVADAIANGRPTRAVINMSLGGPTSSVLNSAVSAAIASGLTVVVAAGNNGASAANYSPASVPGAIAVGATDNTDTKPSWSNFGSVLDLFAPGAIIQSAWIGSNTASAYMSGTSMACPHVAGLAAYYIAKEGLATPAAVAARLISEATGGIVKGAGTGSPTLLAYNGNGQ